MTMPAERVPAPTRFFRIISGSQPSIEDFMSNVELGRQPTRELTPCDERLWAGLSMFDTIESAVEHQGRSRRLGRFIAEIRLTIYDDHEAERTGRRDGHWTVWADSRMLLNRVTAIIPADREEG